MSRSVTLTQPTRQCVQKQHTALCMRVRVTLHPLPISSLLQPRKTCHHQRTHGYLTWRSPLSPSLNTAQTVLGVHIVVYRPSRRMIRKQRQLCFHGSASPRSPEVGLSQCGRLEPQSSSVLGGEVVLPPSSHGQCLWLHEALEDAA